MRKLLILLIAVTLLLGYQSGASAWDESWDFSSPSGTDDSGQLDSFIQDTKKSFAERLNGDHFFDEDNDLMNELTAGDHRHVTMLEKQAAPAHAASTGIVYTIADGTDTELGYTDAGGNDLQITVDGGLNLSGGYSITDLTISNSLSVGNDVAVTDNIAVGGDVVIGGVLSLDGSLRVEGTTTILGKWTLTDEDQDGGAGAALVKSTLYTAGVDGEIAGYAIGVSGNGVAGIIIDGISMPTNGSPSTSGNHIYGYSALVGKGSIWQITSSNTSATNIRFLPFNRGK